MALLDLHIHLQHRSPCSRLSFGQLLQHLSHKIEGICITDHHLLQPDSQFSTATLPIFVGTELTCLTEPFSEVQGDLLVYGITEIPPITDDLGKLLSTIHDQGGVAVCAHPYAPYRSAFGDHATSFEFDAIEMNGSVPRKRNSLAKKLAQGMGLPTIGGSDAHSVGALNTMVTEFLDPIDSLSDILAAIKTHRCHGKNL